VQLRLGVGKGVNRTITVCYLHSKFKKATQKVFFYSCCVTNGTDERNERIQFTQTHTQTHTHTTKTHLHEDLALLWLGGSVQTHVGVGVQIEEALQHVQHLGHLQAKRKQWRSSRSAMGACTSKGVKFSSTSTLAICADGDHKNKQRI